MKNISPLNNIHQLGQYGNFENKNDNELVKIKEIKNIFIYQVVQFKNSPKSELVIDNLVFPDVLQVKTNKEIRILWMGPNNWLVISDKNIKNELDNNFSIDRKSVV